MKIIGNLILIFIFLLTSCKDGKNQEKSSSIKVDQQENVSVDSLSDEWVTESFQNLIDSLEAEAEPSKYTVILCPYCESRITDTTRFCLTCNEDVRNDAAYELTPEQYEAMKKGG